MHIARMALIIGLAAALGCGGKKKAAPPAEQADPAGSAKVAPVLQPTVDKVEGAMQKESDRATPDPGN